MFKVLSFASGVLLGALLACAACSSGPATPLPDGYYGGPPPSKAEISRAMSELQHARYVLQSKAANDYRGHKANAIGYIDDAIGELQVCQSLP
jgi:hypothetical protein